MKKWLSKLYTSRFLPPRNDHDYEASLGLISRAPRSRFSSLCRTLGLGLFFEAWHKSKGRYQAHETRKVAIRKDRSIAALAGLIHLLPASVAITIGILNTFGYYIGEELAGLQGQDTEKFAGLQLAAKLHELTIQASITTMLLQYVRHELALSDGMPFGALFASQLYKDISFLWSSEFWGTANGHFSTRKRKWRMIILLVLCAILGFTVGPASANIMKPRAGIWPAGGTDFWIGVPPGALWSSNFTEHDVSSTCAIDTNDRSCPYGDWKTLTQEYLPYWAHLQNKGTLPGSIRIPGFRSVREMCPQIRSTSQQYSQPLTVATTQYATVAEAVAETGRLWAWVVAAAWRTKGQPWRFWSHSEATFSVPAYQPIVHARCSNFSISNANPSSNKLTFYDLSDYKAFQRTGEFPLITAHTTTSPNATINLSGPSVEWVSIQQVNTGRSALAATVRLPYDGTKNPQVYPCTIDARIAPAKVQGTRNTYEVVTSHIEGSTIWIPAGTKATYGLDKSWPAINIDPQWAAYLNPLIASDNTTVFHQLVIAAGLQNAKSLQGLDRGCVIESILTLMIANGLARSNFNQSIVGDLQGWDFDSESPSCGLWCNEMMPLHKPMGRGGNVYTLDATAQKNAIKLAMYAEVSGYAYSSNGATTVLSIAVLFLYSCIVLGHWFYMIWVQESSNSWQSSAEIAALAVNSRPTQLLHNTGAGIETSKIFKHRVRVISVGERVELSFRDQPDEEKIAFNAWYS